MRGVVYAAAAFAAMEPITAALHRWLFHGPGWRLHRSHHQPTRARLEANDVFPAALAALTVAAMALGARHPSLSALLPIGAGVTAYGGAYAVVHDLYIHRRLPLLPRRAAALEPLRAAHELHHRFGGAPYGMLAPLAPRRVRERAAAAA